MDHVAVRDDVAIRRDDEARTGSRRRGATAPWPRPRRDADDGRPHVLDHRDDDSRVGVQEPAVVRLSLNHAFSTSTPLDAAVVRDRKSTRLNSSHGYISYAVFCL